MAQVSKARFDQLRGGEARRSGLVEALRLDEVPRGVLAAIAVLAVVAVALSVVLFVRTTEGRGVALVRGQGIGAAEQAPVAQQPAVSQAAAPAQDAAPVVEEQESPCLVVHVAGAVAAPGVYELAEGSRVVDAVQAAGGALGHADLAQLNLAEPVVDGSKVTVPAVGEAPVGPVSAVEPPGGGQASNGVKTVNVNTASADELTELVGVGEATAAAIVRDREANGPFASPEDLMRVSGIGEKKFENMRAQVTV